MKRILPFVCALVLTVPAGHGNAQALNLEFLPPDIEPSDVCFATPAEIEPEEDETGGEQATLTDADRVTFLRRDIRQYLNEDANQFFDFIDALIDRRAALDETFTEVDTVFAKVDLWLRAGRLEALEDAGMIAGLRAQVDQMSNNQRVTLARFFAEGIGVARDAAFAQSLIREAAFGGNARALLEIARLEQEGTLVEGWDAPLDLTVTMAFGGILGALDSGVCRRAERIAEAYLKGDVVVQNPALALAWYRFAADLGRAESAWRVVEFHLNADAAEKDNLELRHYLEQAVRLGITVSQADGAALVGSGAVSAEELQGQLGFNVSQDGRRTAKSLSDKLQLDVNLDTLEPGEDGEYLRYLREITQMPEAPGRVFARLASEVLTRKGRWAGEADALVLLEEGARRGDGPSARRLARMLIRYRDDPAQIARAESLLMEVVARHGMPQAMRDLDTLYRCQINDAPRLRQAENWAASYRASGHGTVSISASDLMTLAPDRTPETIAKIQTLALLGRAQMVASHAQRVQGNPLAPDAALQFWAGRANGSKPVLEAFAELEFELARTPVERALALELFRRVYLHNGVATALDLAVVLVDHAARDPEIATEIAKLLTIAGNRGEGGAIRLLARLQTGTRSKAEVYREFAEAIEDRGDFLGMMFAIPHVSQDKVDDYIDRAVSLMNCGTKDADELGDAYALRGNGQMSYHWRKIGLHFEGGHVLSRLRLSNEQMGWFNDGSAPSAADAALRAQGDGDPAAPLRLIALTANAGLETYDAEAAAGHLVQAIGRSEGAEIAKLIALYRAAPAEVQEKVEETLDVTATVKRAAEAGSVEAAFEYGMFLRDRAQAAVDLGHAAKWLEEAAKRGHRDGMFEFGYVLGFGLGRPVDALAALSWLERAAAAGHPRAEETAHVLRVQYGL